MNIKEQYLQKLKDQLHNKDDKKEDELDDLWFKLTEDEMIEVNEFVMKLNLQQ